MAGTGGGPKTRAGGLLPGRPRLRCPLASPALRHLIGLGWDPAVDFEEARADDDLVDEEPEDTLAGLRIAL